MNTNTDDMATSYISTIIKKAVDTFASKPDVFKKNLEQLAYLFNNLRASHVNLHPMFMKETTWTSKAKAPMTYVHIFSDELVNVGIFILKPNMKLPLHNHPEMCGLLKVIAGTVKIRSYSLNTEKTMKYSSDQKKSNFLKLVAERMNDITANSDADCCILHQNLGNLHEIESVDGPAAFIDILSPPYDVDIPGVGERKCSYFTVTQEYEPGVYELQEIKSPSWFWSDSFPYMGPVVRI